MVASNYKPTSVIIIHNVFISKKLNPDFMKAKNSFCYIQQPGHRVFLSAKSVATGQNIRPTPVLANLTFQGVITGAILVEVLQSSTE